MSYETWISMQGFDAQDEEFYEAMRDAWKAGYAEGACTVGDGPGSAALSEEPGDGDAPGCW